MRRALPWLTAALIILLDRGTKAAVLRCIPEGGWVPVIPGVALTHVHNSGIAFSLFADGGPVTRIVLQAFIVVAVVVIAWVVYRHGSRGWATSVALGLILGGAAGNLLDRVLYGWVVDFLRLWAHVGQRMLAWPDFNVADSAITVGAAILILTELRRKPEVARDASDPD